MSKETKEVLALLQQIMNSTILYRRIRDDESGTVSELARRVFQECVAEFQSPEGQQEFHRYSAPEALRQRDTSGYVTIVAEQEGRIVGMLHLKDNQHIAMLFIERAHQRKGVGRELFRLAKEHARRSIQPVCEMTVASSPNSIQAYLRLGFVPVGNEQTLKGLRFVAMKYELDSSCGEGRKPTTAVTGIKMNAAT